MEEMSKQVLMGKVTGVPTYPSDVVKVYLCSSAQDMVTERTHLLKHALPRLRQYCKEKYNMDFQLVDLKWGVLDFEFECHSGLTHCLEAINDCRSSSVGPNYVLLLGQKYGPMILQDSVAATAMEALCATLESTDASFLKTYYRLDENAKPPRYVKDVDAEVGDDVMKVEAKLKTLFKDAARKAENSKTLGAEEASKFYTSGIEQEIIEGLMNNKNAEKECLVFTRHFPAIDLRHKNAHKYIDMVNHAANKDAQKQLVSLLEHKIIPKLPEANLFQYTDLKWGSAKHGGVSELTHGEYLEDLAADFVGALQTLIDGAVKVRAEPARDEMYLECLAHAEVVTERCTRFYGRDKELKAIRKYIDDSRSSSALMLCGPSGCGKSTLIAKAASMALGPWNQQRGGGKSIQIVRFLGVTPATADIDALLKNLIKHLRLIIADINKTDVETDNLLDDFESLSYTFNHLIGQIPKNDRLILFFDAIDELESSKEAFTKMWIPSRLPPNVRVVVSVVEERNTPFQLLSFGNVLEIRNLEPIAVQEFIQNSLEAENRTLTKFQWGLLRKTLGNGPQRALYVKLIMDLIINWHSYDKELVKLPGDVGTYIKKMLERLEADHGRVLVTHTITFIELAKYGVSVVEMEDLLSLNEEVMEEVFEHFVSPLRRFPSLLLRKILHSAKYIVSKHADNATVLGWYHKQFGRVIQSRYNPSFPPSNDFKSHVSDMVVHTLTDYFTGKWVDLPKPFQYTKKQLRRTGLLNPFAESLRCVPKQPTMLVTLTPEGDMRMDFNHRKLSVLLDAYLALIRSNMDGALDLLNDFTEHVIFDYEMIYALLQSGRVKDLVQVQELCAIAIPTQCSQELMRRELFLFSEIIIQDIDFLRQHPQCCGSFLVSMCLDFYGLLPSLTRFIDSVDTLGRDACALVPTSQHMVSCVSRAQCRVIDHSGPVYGAICTEMCIYSLSKRLVAARYEISGYTTVYNKLLHPPPGDYFAQILAAKGQWDAGFEAESDNMEWVILYLVLANRPHIYVIQGSTGQQLRVIRCNELVKEVQYKDPNETPGFRINTVHAIGSQNSAWHLLCVSFHCGVVLVIHSQTQTVIWKSIEEKKVISLLDIGFFRGSHVYGFAESSGKINWLCWRSLQEETSSQNFESVQPNLKPSALPNHGEEVFTHVESIVENLELRSELEIDRVLDDTDTNHHDSDIDPNTNTKGRPVGFSEYVHTVAATDHGTIVAVSDVVEIAYYNNTKNVIKVEKSAATSKTLSLSLPCQEPVKCLAGKMALSSGSLKGIIAACSTARNSYLLAFNREQQTCTVTHVFEKTFDDVLLRSGLLVGVFGSAMELFNVAEHDVIDSLVVQRLVELDEQRGRVMSIYSSSHTGVMLVTCSEFNTMAIYLTHLLNVHSGDSFSGSLGANKKRTAQTAVASISAAANVAITLSRDNRDVVIWDIQNDCIKREIHVKETVEQFCISITETHVVVITVSDKVLLYTVDHDEDMPASHIKHFHITSASSCWMTSLHTQPHVICIISKLGAVFVINVHTCQMHAIQETRLPQGIDCVMTRNHDIYVIAHKWRSFLGIQPGDNTITWELDMNSASGKSLQKFGRRITDLCEYNGDVYVILTGNPQFITSTQDMYTLLCIKPTANSIFKIMDLTLPKTTQVICSTGESNYILLCHSNQVQVVDLSQGTVCMTESLQQVCMTSDGHYIAGIRNSRELKLFRMLDKRCIATYTLRIDPVAIAISTDDEYITVVGADRQIYSFAMADPYKQEHSIAIKKLPSRNRAVASDPQYAKEDSRFELLHQMTKILDSSGYVSEATSSLDSAYEHASRVYSFGNESRTTRDRIRGDDLLTKVFGEDQGVINAKESKGSDNSSTSTLKNEENGADDANQTSSESPNPIDQITRVATNQSLESVDIPVAISSAQSESPSKPILDSLALLEAGLQPETLAVKSKDLHIDLSELENPAAQNELITSHRSLNIRHIQDRDEAKSIKTAITHKSGDVLQNVLLKTQHQSHSESVANSTGTSQSKFSEMTPCKPFVLSYKSAVLQQSTQERLQKIKNQFVEVGLDDDLDNSLSASGTERMIKSTRNRSGRMASSHKGELVASYRKRSRSRSKSPKSTKLPEGNKTSRACVIS